jgi:peptide/nickel transport system permease protein
VSVDATAGAELEAAMSAPERPLAASRKRLQVSVGVALVMLLASLLVIVVVPFLPNYDPYRIDLGHALAPPFAHWTHPLGTDALGRDTLSRLAVAGKSSLLIAVPALALTMVVGVTVGLVAGYFGGIANSVIMGLADLQLSIPIVILVIMVVSVVGPSERTLVVVIGLTYWIGYGRVARVVALMFREREFVLAAKTFGANSLWIIRKHLLPQLGPQLAILGAFDLGVIIILEASLSYLGLGIQPPTPSWGKMVAEGQIYAERDAWLVVFPAAAIFMLVASVQILSQRFTAESEKPVSTRAV